MSGINATGASLVLKMDGVQAWATEVVSHTVGHDTLGYAASPEFESALVNGQASGHYFLENKLAFLDQVSLRLYSAPLQWKHSATMQMATRYTLLSDSMQSLDMNDLCGSAVINVLDRDCNAQETEWFFDRENRTLHVKTRGDQHPCDLRVLVRVQEYAFRIIDTSHLVLRDLNFFGTGVWAASLGHSDSVTGITFDSLRLKFPSATKRMLGDYTFYAPTTLFTRNTTGPTLNAIVNCSFEGAETAPVVYLHNAGLLLDNNRFGWNDWSTVATKPCWPNDQGPLLPDETLASRQPFVCSPSYNFSTSVASGAALDPGEGTALNPTKVLRTSISNFASRSGIFCSKNCEVMLSDISHASNLWDGGALLDSEGHDLHERIAPSGLTSTWTPPVCSDYNVPPFLGDRAVCIGLGGCIFDGAAEQDKCQGFPAEIDLVPDDTNANARHGVKFSYNWAHDAREKMALRFRRDVLECNGRTGDTWPMYGEMTRNVGWNTRGIEVSGGEHLIHRNTIFKSHSGADMHVHDEYGDGLCACGSATCSLHQYTCCVEGINSTFEGRGNVISANALQLVPMFAPTYEAIGNLAGDFYQELQHTAVVDFRPVLNGTFHRHDAGAYDAADAGSGEYWIPGSQSFQTSNPLPADGAQQVDVHTDLIFLPGRTRYTYPKEHRVFVACSIPQLEYEADLAALLSQGPAYPNQLDCRCETDDGSRPPSIAGVRIVDGVLVDAVCGSGMRYSCANIFRVPPELARHGKTIFWRVDSIMTSNGRDSTRVPGPIWSLTYSRSVPAARPMGPCPDNCKIIYEPSPPVPSDPPSLFARLDVDQSGSLSMSEVLNGILVPGSTSGASGGADSGMAGCTTGGGVEEAAIPYQMDEQEVLERFQGCKGSDLDGDGEISVPEFVSRPLPDPPAPSPPVPPTMLTWVPRDVSTGSEINVSYEIYREFPQVYEGCRAEVDDPIDNGGGGEEVDDGSEPADVAPDPPQEMCATGSSATFDCNFYINIRCRDFVDKGHAWSKGKQREYLSRCMAQDCEQSLENAGDESYDGCRYVDENGFCYSKKDSQAWCASNPTSVHCLNDGGVNWAPAPLGELPASRRRRGSQWA